MGNTLTFTYNTHRRIIIDKQTEAEITKEANRLGFKVCHFRGFLLKKGLAALQEEQEPEA